MKEDGKYIMCKIALNIGKMIKNKRILEVLENVKNQKKHSENIQKQKSFFFQEFQFLYTNTSTYYKF